MNYNDNQQVKDIIKLSLREDLGRGDITTGSVISSDAKIEAAIIAKEKGVACGMDIAGMVFRTFDKRIRFLPLVNEGARVKKGKVLAKICGPASSILSSERVALNFLGFLSGIATRTEEFVKRIRPYKVRLLDTRKTIPGLRKLQKYAVRAGGGENHRLSLGEMVLIKDNHMKVMGYGLKVRGLGEIIKEARKEHLHKVKIEIEVKNLKEFKEALNAMPDIIMLDNMGLREIRKAVQIKKSQSVIKPHPQPQLEASGNINLKNIRAYAATGIDFISLGTLTKDIRSLDLSLEVQ